MILRAAMTPKAAPAGRLNPEKLERFAGVEQKLSSFVRLPTVSYYDTSLEDEDAFSRISEEFKRQFPLVSSRLLHTQVGNRGHVFEWPGSNTSLKPMLLTSHFDVVPQGEGVEWEYPPFSGEIANGYVHGRGTQDVKISLVCALEAAEQLLAANHVPERTIFFAFGGDEEVSGVRGAGSIAKSFSERGLQFSFLLDEGGPVLKDLLKFIDRPLALIGITEKGYVDVAITAESAGGHASMPPKHTASGIVARAVTKAEASQFPARITKTVAEFLNKLSVYSPFAFRLIFRNLFITTPLVKRFFSSSPASNALMRTTTAATMLMGSKKENVLPEKAKAIINMRILPGSSVSETIARMNGIAQTVGARADYANLASSIEPMPESPIDHEGYAMISKSLEESFPEAGVIPFMFTANTDTRHYVKLTEAIYRFLPLLMSQADLKSVHAVNERISIENVRRCTLFYYTLIKDFK
jgi:carboxypeptidase PM20D1